MCFFAFLMFLSILGLSGSSIWHVFSLALRPVEWTFPVMICPWGRGSEGSMMHVVLLWTFTERTCVTSHLSVDMAVWGLFPPGKVQSHNLIQEELRMLVSEQTSDCHIAQWCLGPSQFVMCALRDSNPCLLARDQISPTKLTIDL